jgi:hypothetical protein
MKKIILISFLITLSFSSSAQKGVSLSVDYEIPLGELAFVYKPTTSYTFSFLSADDDKIWNFSIGYYSFIAKQDTFYYLVGENNYGIATQSNYSIIPLYVGLASKIRLSDKIDFLPGIDLGYYYVWYKYTSRDPMIEDSYSTVINVSGSNIEGKGVLSPKVGLSYKFTEALELKFQSKYNIFFSLGSQDSESIYYNPNVGTYNISWSNGLSLIYNF